MNEKSLRESQCDQCLRIFYRKLVPNKSGQGGRILTKINEVTYWTDGKSWQGYQILCRNCLNNWFENQRTRVDFHELVKDKKRLTFLQYRYLGIFNKEIYQD